MNLLALDTSTTTAFVALHSNGHFYEQSQDVPRQHALRILPMIEALLSEATLTVKELDGIVFGRGPGSFTGLRIAASVTQGLAFAHDLPVYPVSTLAAIVEAAASKNPVLAVIDARMNEVYWALDCHDGKVVSEHVGPAATINVPEKPGLILAGVGFEAYLADFNSTVATQLRATTRIFPTARAMLSLVLKGKVAPVLAKEALPVYIRNKVTQ